MFVAVIVLVGVVGAGCSREDPPRSAAKNRSTTTALAATGDTGGAGSSGSGSGSDSGSTSTEDVPSPADSGGDSAVISVSLVGDASTPHCKNEANWAARQLDSIDNYTPAQLLEYVKDWKNYVAVGFATRPVDQQAQTDWLQYVAAVSSLSDALTARGGDIAALEAQDPADGVLLGTAVPDYLGNILVYAQEVCGAGEQPVTDAAPSASTSICATLAPLIADQLAAESGGSTPTQIEAIANDYQALATSALSGSQPVVADIKKVGAWMSQHYTAPLRAVGWDLRRYYRSASGPDLVALSGWSPEIRDSLGRLNALIASGCPSLNGTTTTTG